MATVKLDEHIELGAGNLTRRRFGLAGCPAGRARAGYDSTGKIKSSKFLSILAHCEIYSPNYFTWWRASCILAHRNQRCDAALPACAKFPHVGRKGGSRHSTPRIQLKRIETVGLNRAARHRASLTQIVIFPLA